MSPCATITLEQGLIALGSIVGAEHVELRGDYALLVNPADLAQVAEVLRFAGANGLALIPTGGGTKLGWGNPVQGDILLSLGRMNQLREHAWQDMTCTVEAGCPWVAMQSRLAWHGQMVALDPLWPDRATVGGIVACNDSGALRLRYGGLRDLVLGMTIVLADGTIAKTGGKVVKNVAGYDLHKLMIGSFGTLAVITELNFRLHPVASRTQTWTATGSAIEQLQEPLRNLRNSQLAPSCVQLRVSRTRCALDVRLAAPAECLEEYAARLHSLLARFELAESPDHVWQARQELFENPDLVVMKVSVPPGEICPMVRELQELAAARNLKWMCVAQATGLMTVALGPNSDAISGLIEQLRRRAAGSDGSATVLRVPDSLRGNIHVWGPDPSAMSLMREIKRRFDPTQVLNPGRFIGGI